MTEFYLITPRTRGFRKYRENVAVTSSISEAWSAKASTFVEHLTILVEIKRCPGTLIFPPSVITDIVPILLLSA